MANLSLPLDPPLPSTCTLYHGDCLNVMPTLAPQSIRMSFCDLPYAITACKWDVQIDVASLWSHLSNCLTNDAIVCATATLRFVPMLMTANALPFKYDLVWHKSRATGFLSSKKAPLRAHELILVFGKGTSIYNPQMQKTWRTRRGTSYIQGEHGRCYGTMTQSTTYIYSNERYPTSVIEPVSPAKERGAHPTQKPVALLEWLVATYTNPGDTVLDPVMGSGTTAIACARLGRNFIGIEKDKTYFDVASKRIAAERERLGL